MKVLSSKRGERTQTLLFEYDPVYWVGLPTISISTNDKIVIAVPWVSSIVARRYEWRGVQIEYDIGKISDPDPGRRLGEKD
jgi:hypothetical protein